MQITTWPEHFLESETLLSSSFAVLARLYSIFIPTLKRLSLFVCIIRLAKFIKL